MKELLMSFLLLLNFIFSVCAQTTVTGLVKDKLTGEPLIGVSITIKNTTLGTYTNATGNFSITVPVNVNNPVLTFSYVGYSNMEIVIGNQQVFDIALEEESRNLSEVVVIGYGVQKKKDLTGSVSTVDGSSTDKFAVAGIDQALQGRAAGVSVTQMTGQPGDPISIRIRGTGSIYSDDEPLYVIDGIPTKDPNALTSLSTGDIANITILKDAASAAIYGSRANNGVVLITTKQAAKGESKIEFKSQIGYQTHGPLTPMANTQQYVNIYNVRATNDNESLFIPAAFAATLPNVNHMAEIFQTAPMQTYNLSISGGNEKTTYNISGSYFDQVGIIFNSGYTRATGRINIKSEVKDWLTVNAYANLFRSSTDILASTGDGAGGNGSNPVRYAFFRNPAVATYDSTGNYVDLPIPNPKFPLETPYLTTFFGDGYNPLGVAKNTHNNKLENGYSLKFNPVIKLSRDLSFVSNAGIDYNTYLRRNFNVNWGTGGRINSPNSLTVENSYTSTWTVNNVFTWSKTFNEKHNITIMAGEESIGSTTYDESTTAQGFPDQDANLTYLSNATGLEKSGETQTAYTLQSFFARANYDYKGKYLLSAVVRDDGSSKFAPAHQWGTFYSGSFGWVVSDEAFFKGMPVIDRLKIRGGYGLNGNQDIPNDYPFIDQLSPQNNYPFSGAVSSGFAPHQLGNVNLTWETATQLDLGADLVLWKGIVDITFDYFYKVTYNMLVQEPLPPSVGYSYSQGAPWENNGKILNEGFEIEATHKKRIGDFEYNISANIATLHNEVLQLNGVINDVEDYFSLTRTEKGYPIGSFFMYKMQGIFQNQSDIISHSNQSSLSGGAPIRPGDVMYEDVRGTGVIDSSSRTHVGSPIPTLTGGLTLSVDYKGFDFSVFFQGAYGDVIYKQIDMDIEGYYRGFNVTQRYYNTYWRGPGTSNTEPLPSSMDSQNYNIPSTRYIEDGSYIRLKNLQIGYTLPASLTKKIKINRARIYFSGINLYTFTKYTGLDPEMGTNNNAQAQGQGGSSSNPNLSPGTNLVRNVDWGTYPVSITYNVGLELTL